MMISEADDSSPSFPVAMFVCKQLLHGMSLREQAEVVLAAVRDVVAGFLLALETLLSAHNDVRNLTKGIFELPGIEPPDQVVLVGSLRTLAAALEHAQATRDVWVILCRIADTLCTLGRLAHLPLEETGALQVFIRQMSSVKTASPRFCNAMSDLREAASVFRSSFWGSMAVANTALDVCNRYYN